jgi:hypothetical protein
MDNHPHSFFTFETEEIKREKKNDFIRFQYHVYTRIKIVLRISIHYDLLVLRQWNSSLIWFEKVVTVIQIRKV